MYVFGATFLGTLILFSAPLNSSVCPNNILGTEPRFKSSKGKNNFWPEIWDAQKNRKSVLARDWSLKFVNKPHIGEW